MAVPCLFATDLHGRIARYERLFAAAEAERPAALLLGGDLLPGGPGEGLTATHYPDFWNDFLAPRLARLRSRAGSRVLVILGNDDPRREEAALLDLAVRGLAEHIHGRWTELGGYRIGGYSYVPPTPFWLKDWERYDISRFVDPGCISPEEGKRTLPVPPSEARWATIAADLAALAPPDEDLSRSVLLFHSPPYQTRLDRAALDGMQVDHAPLDLHVGSIAIRRFIESRQPLLTLHGHVHESARLTGDWRDQIGATTCLSAAHDGPELALVRFDLTALASASRELL